MPPFSLWGENMDFFSGIVPDERWKNEVLNEIRKTNELLQKLLDRDAQAVKEEAPKRQYRKRREIG